MKPNVSIKPNQPDVASSVLLNFSLWETMDDLMNGRKRMDTAFAKLVARTRQPPVLRSTAFEDNSLGEVPAVVDHAESLVAGLTRGLADLPNGPKRALECDIRRAEVLEGVGQILNVVDATERAIGEEKDPANISVSERDCYAGRLRWAAGMTKGLRQGVADLVWYDTYAVPGEVYATINGLLSECESRVSRLSYTVEELGPKEEEEEDEDNRFDAPEEASRADALTSERLDQTGAQGLAPSAVEIPFHEENLEASSDAACNTDNITAGAASVSEMVTALKKAREEVKALLASADCSVEEAAAGVHVGVPLIGDDTLRKLPPAVKEPLLTSELGDDDWLNDFMAKYVHRALTGVSELFSSETEDIERLFTPNQMPVVLDAEQDHAAQQLAAMRAAQQKEEEPKQVESY